MGCVSEFPFIDAHDFKIACDELASLLPDSKVLQNPVCLRISKRLTGGTSGSGIAVPDVDQEPDTEEIQEHDQELAPVHFRKHAQEEKEALFVVDYDIGLSPSYRVPVLYMTIKPPCSVSEVFDLLVPFHFQSALRETGIIGALSMTDHPATGMPAYFVHPCRTAEAMRSTGMQYANAKDYMLIWLGIIGASVGLNVPSADMLRAT